MSASTSTSFQILDPDLCERCNNSIHYPCEILQWVDCDQCQDQWYKCDACDGKGRGQLRLQNGTYPPCGICGREGRLRGCPSCNGDGCLSVVGRYGQGIPCEDCGGQGLRPCQCNEEFRVLQFVGLCPGDCRYGLPRIHPKPPTNPKSSTNRDYAILKEDWGEMVLPYQPRNSNTQ